MAVDPFLLFLRIPLGLLDHLIDLALAGLDQLESQAVSCVKFFHSWLEVSLRGCLGFLEVAEPLQVLSQVRKLLAHMIEGIVKHGTGLTGWVFHTFTM